MQSILQKEEEEKKSTKYDVQYLLMPMGGLAHGSVHARPSAQPPIYMREIFRAHLCRVAFKHLLQPIKCHMQSFRALGKFVTPFSTPNTHIAGERRGGTVFPILFSEILIFLNSWTTPSVIGRKVNTPE